MGFFSSDLSVASSFQTDKSSMVKSLSEFLIRRQRKCLDWAVQR